jgi:hypothetical protein
MRPRRREAAKEDAKKKSFVVIIRASIMLLHLPISLSSPVSLQIAAGLFVLMVVLVLVRRVVIRRTARLLILLGSVLLVIAAGRPSWMRPSARSVTVMVDLSPSTRGATFRDRAALLQRIHQLIPDRPYQLLGFSDHTQPLPLDDTLGDLPCDKTVFAPPPADAIVLFSDGQFDLPAFAGPTYPVIDPALDHTADAAVTDIVPFNQQVQATVRNAGTARHLIWTGAQPRGENPANGDFTQLAAPLDPSAQVTAALSPGDRWPENDALSLARSPPENVERWWIGENCPTGYRQFAPQNLPMNTADYLHADLIVLNNIPADALSTSQQQHLTQYVQDLGGTLLINGGDHAFAAGFYEGTALEELSPLASSPPQPAIHWMLLIDGSGSMAGDGSSPSPWQTEVTAITLLLPALPPHDALSIGSFAQSLTWWSVGKSVENTRPLPPAGIGPTGPTHLAAALRQIAADSDTGASAPSQLLLMTDADTDLPDPEKIADALNRKKIHLHLLAIGNGKALPALQQIASLTAGSVLTQLDPGQWVSSANLLLRSAMPDRYRHQPISPASTAQPIPAWNQTWLKTGATALQKSGDIPLQAGWQAGSGQVLAIAYPADNAAVETLTRSIAGQPNDPRFTITCTTGPTLRINLDAIDGSTYLNNEKPQIEMRDTRNTKTTPTVIPLSLIAPGRYETNLPAPRSGQLVTIRNGGQILKRFPLAGRYAPEFDHIGNDRANLQALADRTGESVILPGPAAPIDFHWPTKQTDLTSPLLAVAFVLVALGLMRR